MTMAIADVASRFEDPKQTGDESWIARCSGHDDRKRSLSISTGAKGIVLHCHAGCDPVAVTKAAGLKFKDLFFDVNGNGASSTASTSIPKRQREADAATWNPVAPVPEDAPPCDFRFRSKAPVKTWEYLDTAGRLIGYSARYEFPDGKEFTVWTFGNYGTGELHWRHRSWKKPRPLYGLPQLAQFQTEPLYITEGEKCCDALKTLLPDRPVLAWSGGAGQVGTADFSPLYGRESVVLWPDADKPGLDAMRKAAGQLLQYCKNVWILDVSGWERSRQAPAFAGVTRGKTGG